MKQPVIEEDLKTTSVVLKNSATILTGRRVFLTGGTGFFGQWLLHSFIRLRQLCHGNFSLSALTRDPRSFLDNYPEFREQPGIDFIQGDVRSFTLPPRASFDFVIHGATAASAKLEQENPEEMYSVITEGTRHVLDFTKKCAAQRLLYISSGAVYGTQPPEISHLPETFEGVPTTAYGRGKKVSEQLCLEASEGHFECVIARPFAFVGPYLPLDTHFAIGNFIRDCLANRPIVIQGDGTPLRSYLYAADLIEWLWTLLLRGTHTRAYNVGSEQAIAIKELAHLVRQTAGTQNEIIVQKHHDANTLPARYVPSVARAADELSLKQSLALAEALQRTIAWYHTTPPCCLMK